MTKKLVVTWNNEGNRAEHQADDEREAIALAMTFRTLAYRTVKVADAFGSTHHWARSTSLAKTHWTARAVANIACN